MAISSVLAPEKITGRQTPTFGAAQKFISGGSPLGSSVVSSAANKIVGFQRSAAVRPVIPDVNSIISSISSNIVNTVNNSIGSSSLATNKIIENKIQNLRNEIFQIVKNIQNKIENISIIKDQKNESINYINQSKIESKKELINYINQSNIENKKEIINQINQINNTVLSNKKELINYISNSDIKNKQEVINLITEIRKDIAINKNELIEYTNKTLLQLSTNKISNLETKINQVNQNISQVESKGSNQQGFGGITTKFTEVVQNIRQNVDSTLNKTIINLTTQYNKKIQDIDAAQPSGILKKFFDTYKTAIGFIQFFGNKKNISKLQENLNVLKESFTESFNVAKLLRQVINKIVKQLSNLPKSSGIGRGGLNIDLDIPGPKLKQSLPRGASQVGRAGKIGRIASIGALGLGAGAAGAGVVNALADTGQVQPAIGEPMIPGSIVDGFSAIVERFSSAVEELIKGATGKKKTQATAKPGGGGGAAPSAPPAASGPSSYTPGTIPQEVSQDTSFTKGVTDLAKKYNVPEDYLYAVMGFETGGTFSPSKRNQSGSGATGLIQFMPETAERLGTSTESLSKMSRTEQLKYVDKYFEGTLNKGASLSDVYMSVLFPAAVGKSENFVLFGKGAMSGFTGEAYTQNKGLDLNKDGSVTKAEAAKKVEEYLPKSSKVSPAKEGIQSPSVSPSGVTPSAKASLATNISQPPPQSSEPQVNIMPLDMSQNNQPTNQASISPPSAQQKEGPTVPFLPAGNPDNFLILYSKMVYNIVDG